MKAASALRILYLSTRLNGVTSQKPIILIFIVVRISVP
jgi:hypothetical protein